MTEITIRSIGLDNKSGRKARAQIHYNETTKALTIVLNDKIDTLYIDANPNKKVEVPAKWLLSTTDKEEGEVAVEDAEPNQQS